MSKSCFVIAPIGEAASEIRKRSDKVLRHIITPAVKACGYDDPVRADQIAEPGLITSQVIQHIVNDSLVIADLTDRNPNVFYELAIRHAIRKPLVQLIRKGEQIPFDVAGMRTIQVDIQDLDSVEETKEEIISQVKTVEQKAKEIETPISVSINLQSLKASDRPEERSIAELLSALTELRSSIGSVEKRLSSPERLIPIDYFEHMIRRSGIFEENRLHPEAINDIVRGIRAIAKDFPEIKSHPGYEKIQEAYRYISRRMRSVELLIEG